MFLIALALFPAASTDRWVHVGRSASQYEDYLDRESVKRSGDKVSLWTRRDYTGGKRTAWNEIEYDCAARTETILAYVQDEGGTVSHNVERPHRAAAPIAAGSVEERIFALACR